MSSRFTPMERMVRARIQLLMHSPFFGTLAMRLMLVEAPKGPTNPFGTMATDGHSITFAPEFLAKLSDKEIEGVIAHEVLHVALKHHLRRKRRDPKLWNIACDATINCDLIEAKFTLPEPRVDMPEHKGKAAETIFAELDQDQQGGGGGGGGGQDWGDVLDDPDADGSEAEQSEAEHEVNIMVAQAAQAQERHNQAKGKGTIPAWMKRMVQEIVAPELPWEDVLRRFVTARIPYDQSWSKLNRRFAGGGTYLPGVLKNGLGEIAMLFDTSGSMTDKMMTRIFGEVNAVKEDCRPEKLHAIACDASVGNYIILEEGDDLKPDIFVGGGGSDFRPAFEKLQADGVNILCCVVFSDMDIDFPEVPPNFPVLMVSTTDNRGPDWGAAHVRLRQV
jgi:predicted metal-dependent peptidase